MGTLHRKLFPFLASTSNNNGSAPCADCEPSCSDFDDCYALPGPEFLSPLPSPTLTPLPSPIAAGATQGSLNISPAVIVVITVLASVFLLVAYYAIVVKYFSDCSRLVVRRRGADDPPPPPSDVRGADDFFHDLDGQDPIVDHPIWLISTVGLQQSVINSIAAVRYKRGEGLIEGTDCSVCLSEFLDGDSLRLLPKCNHAFHIDCIDTWLRSHTNCPLCRAAIVVSSGRSLASNDPSFWHSRRVEFPRVDDSGSSDGEVTGGAQTRDGNEAGQNRGETGDNGQVKRDHDERVARSYSMDHFRVSNHPNGNVGGPHSQRILNSSSSRAMAASSSASTSAAGMPLQLLGAPIKRSYSWSERVFWSTHHLNHRVSTLSP